MVDTPRANKAEILPRVAHVGASLVDILMLGGDQRNYRQQIGCCLPRAEHHIANAADKRFGDIFDTMQLLLRREACEWRHGMRIRCELGTVGRKWMRMGGGGRGFSWVWGLWSWACLIVGQHSAAHTHTRTQTRLINTSEIFESGFKLSECKGKRGAGQGNNVLFTVRKVLMPALSYILFN